MGAAMVDMDAVGIRARSVTMTTAAEPINTTHAPAQWLAHGGAALVRWQRRVNVLHRRDGFVTLSF